MIAVDRLVLSIDAMTPQRAQRLVEMTGQALAGEIEQAGHQTGAAIDRIDVSLASADTGDAAIVAALCAAIRARIG